MSNACHYTNFRRPKERLLHAKMSGGCAAPGSGLGTFRYRDPVRRIRRDFPDPEVYKLIVNSWKHNRTLDGAHGCAPSHGK